MKRYQLVRPIFLGVLLAGSGLMACAGTQKTEVNQEQTSSGAGKSSSAKPEDQFTSRSVRLFEDAVAVWEEQKKNNAVDWVSLEKKFRAVIDADGRFAEAYYNLGVVLERERRFDDAKVAYKTALRKKPSLKQASENLAVLFQNEGRPADAVAIYQEILGKYPDDGAARARMAALYRESGDWDRAMRLAREALMREPQNLTAHKVMMRTYLERNNLSMAKLVAMRATRIAQDPELFYTMGLIARKEGDEQGAIIHFRRAIQERDDYLAARIALAEIKTQHRDWNDAAEQYRKIVQYQPKNVAAHVNLGVAYKGSGQIDKAMAEYDAAIKTDPKTPEPYYFMGLLFHKNRDAPEKAIEYYRKFIAVNDQNGVNGPVPAEHPVYENIKECEQYIRQLVDMKAAEERAKVEAQIAKDRGEKEAAEKKRDDEQKRKNAADKAKADEEAKNQAEMRKRQAAARQAVDAALKSGAGDEKQSDSRKPQPTQKSGTVQAKDTTKSAGAKASRGAANDEPSDNF